MVGTQISVELCKTIERDPKIEKLTYRIPSSDLLYHLLLNSPLKNAILEDGLDDSAFGIVALLNETIKHDPPKEFEIVPKSLRFDASGFTLDVSGNLYVPQNYRIHGRPTDGYQIVANYSLTLNGLSLPHLERRDLKSTLLLIPNKNILPYLKVA